MQRIHFILFFSKMKLLMTMMKTLVLGSNKNEEAMNRRQTDYRQEAHWFFSQFKKWHAITIWGSVTGCLRIKGFSVLSQQDLTIWFLRTILVFKNKQRLWRYLRPSVTLNYKNSWSFWKTKGREMDCNI